MILSWHTQLLFSILILLFLTHSSSQLTFKSKFPIRNSPSAPATNRFLQSYNSNSSALNFNLQNTNNWYYTQNMTIELTNQTFNVVFDTGISYIWVPNISLASPNWTNTFNCPGCLILDGGVNQTLNFYQDTITGYIIQQDIQIDGITLNYQDIVLATQIGETIVTQNNYFDFLYQKRFDGYLGLGPAPYSSGYQTFIDNLRQRGLITERWFSCYLSYDLQNLDYESVIAFQSVNDTIVSNQSFIQAQSISNTSWMLSLTNVTFNNQVISNATQAIVATGTQSIVIDIESFHTFWEVLVINANLPCYQTTVANVTQQSIYCTCSGGDISQYPNFTFTLNNSQIEIPATAYTTYRGYLNPDSDSENEDSESNPDTCMINIFPNMGTFGFNDEETSGRATWILGMPFLRAYYAVFDVDQMMMSFVTNPAFSSNGISNPASFTNIFELIGGMTIALVVIVVVVKMCKSNMSSRLIREYQPMEEEGQNAVNGQNN